MTLQAPARSFLPADFDGADLASLERLFQLLNEREINGVDDLERWLNDESELLAHIDAEVARRYIQMTLHTDSEDARESFLQLERDVSPRVKVLKDGLDQKFLSCPATEDLDPDRYSVLARSRRSDKQIFREENTSLQAEESQLQTDQQTLMGGLTVEFRGKTHTLQQLAQHLEDRDRATREEAYRASLEVRRGTWPKLEEILDDLVALRTRMAANAGLDSYIPYRFKQLHRFDYDADDCRRFHDAIEEVVVPAVGRLDARRREALGVSALRPWDLDVDIHGDEPLRPFSTEEELVGMVTRTFAEVDPRFADEFMVLRDEEMLDLMSRRGKAPGGYQYTLEDVRLPFIFMNAVGTHGDVQTLLHEGGHAFHAILSRHDPLVDYRNSPIEFAETASMSMELMGLEQIGEAYGEGDAARARRSHFEKVLRILPWIASIDAFQHWLYDNPGHDSDARKTAWLEIRARMAPGIDYSGIEDALAFQWAAQSHLYGTPLYYVEYGIAQIAALQIWLNYRRDRAAAIEAYRAGLTLGGSVALPQLFEAAGARFDLSPEMLTGLVAEIEAVVAA